MKRKMKNGQARIEAKTIGQLQDKQDANQICDETQNPADHNQPINLASMRAYHSLNEFKDTQPHQ